MTAARVRRAVRRVVRGVRWYLREISGDAAYERHCLRHRRERPDHPAPTRRAYERLRRDHREHTASSRCC
ncbi:YbdD/YjiX family protein [Yinghuangia sp. ASG 101]|uniref:YbdD/YjiX family protein n=1 Tax=Yinghuangia sp. ASG 101 TaxID=2896848 RepID=UPI001E442D8B|nr:YbdD/YjiX family protein [Yinghuangia sp. ASG 101]UGQ10807.1 YbdD/YjiX family protein [Yinghuangia sp. ASG 101]